MARVICKAAKGGRRAAGRGGGRREAGPYPQARQGPQHSTLSAARGGPYRAGVDAGGKVGCRLLPQQSWGA